MVSDTGAPVKSAVPRFFAKHRLLLHGKRSSPPASRRAWRLKPHTEEGHLVIAYLHHHHWAPIWAQVPGWVGAVAKKCIDAGAAMFVSHGAPVLQPVEIYRGRPIFYSLGNFIFHVRSANSPWKAREVWESVIGLCTFGGDGKLASMCFHPVAIGGNEVSRSYDVEMRLVPEIVHGQDAERILHRFREHSAQFGTEIEISGDRGFLKIFPG